MDPSSGRSSTTKTRFSSPPTISSSSEASTSPTSASNSASVMSIGLPPHVIRDYRALGFGAPSSSAGLAGSHPAPQALRDAASEARRFRLELVRVVGPGGDRKSTRLNSSHVASSYAVFFLKKKTNLFTAS